MQTKSHKILFYLDPDFKVEFEDVFPEVNIHCDVERFSPSVLRRMYQVFVQMEEYFKARGYLHMFAITPNVPFCKLFNCKVFGKVKRNNDDKEYEVVVWDLE